MKEAPFPLQVAAFVAIIFPFIVAANCWFLVQIYDSEDGVCGCVQYTFGSYVGVLLP
jgi:hypothetical protein